MCAPPSAQNRDYILEIQSISDIIRDIDEKEILDFPDLVKRGLVPGGNLIMFCSSMHKLNGNHHFKMRALV